MLSFLSARHWHERWPRRLRLIVSLLALLAFVAPTWHVCAMGGHLIGESHTTNGHNSQQQQVSDSEAQRPIICICSGPQSKPTHETPLLDGRESHAHTNCLALLLQDIPNAPALAFRFSVSEASYSLHYPAPPTFVTRSQRLAQRGRAPPVFA